MKVFLFYMAICLICFSIFIVMHEQVHVAIYNKYGIESHVEYFSHFPDVVTVSEEQCPAPECRLGHHINEAVTYVLVPIFFIIMFGFGILIGLKEIELT